MTLVADASFVVAALVDSGPDGEWAQELLFSNALAAPHHMPVEAANILRRAVLARLVSGDAASLAHADLLDLGVMYIPYTSVGRRVWELRGAITAYDASYVAVAEILAAPLATLDARLARATGPRCTFRLPPSRAGELPPS